MQPSDAPLWDLRENEDSRTRQKDLWGLFDEGQDEGPLVGCYEARCDYRCRV